MALSDLVNDPYSDKRYLAEIGAYDISGTVATTVRVSGHGLIRARPYLSCSIGSKKVCKKIATNP